MLAVPGLFCGFVLNGGGAVMLYLQSKNGGDVSIKLDQLRINIGRDSGNDLVLEDPEISGFHAGIFFDNGRVEIVDLGSTNGTYLNGRKLIGREELKPWDLVRFGTDELEIIDPEGRRPTSVMAAISDEMLAGSADRSGRGGAGKPLALLKAVSAGSAETVSIYGTFSIGREPGNNLTLNVATVSTKHAEILVNGGELELVDLSSSNGTFVNGRRISRQLLNNGDRLRFDELEYLIEIPRSEVAKTSINPAVSPPTNATEVNPALGAERIAVPGDAPTRVEPVFGSGPGLPGAGSSATLVEKVPLPPPPLPAPVLEAKRPSSSPDFSQAIPGDVAPPGGFAWLYFSTDGRIGRLKYFLCLLPLIALSFVISALVQQLLFGSITFDTRSFQYLQSTLVVSLITLWPSIALGAKRFHDQDRSGHWLWLLLLPFINLVAGIMLFFVSGTPVSNRFGPPPD